MSEEQQQALFSNTARSIHGVPQEIQLRHARHCYQADKAYGKGIAAAIGLDVELLGS
ncbi:catalase-related domain-containing protein [Pseudoalteromonas holothuriae]|nr:catalase-related domain-containing protein [Pseudoalteromonas sp. CIP111951]